MLKVLLNRGAESFPSAAAWVLFNVQMVIRCMLCHCEHIQIISISSSTNARMFTTRVVEFKGGGGYYATLVQRSLSVE